MEVEVIHGQIIAKANHYQTVPGKNGKKRIIKDEELFHSTVQNIQEQANFKPFPAICPSIP